MRLQETIEVDRPIDEAFAYTGDFTHIEQWDPGVATSAKLTPGTPGVGTEYDVVVAFGPRRTPMRYVVCIYEPPTRVVLEGEGEGIHAIDDIRFEATPIGTRIVYTADISLSGPGALLERFGQGIVLRTVGRRAVRGLQQALSREVPTPRYTVANRVADRTVLPGMLGFTRYGYRLRKRCWRPLAVSLAGRTAIVTGASSGLGRVASEHLAGLGARVVLVGRDEEKTEAVRREIMTATGNEDLAVAVADLGLVGDVRALAERLLTQEARIHILINNAGALFNRRGLTAEGNERSLAVNLLGPFLLTELLIPKLKASQPARIVTVSSGGMYTQKIRVDDLQYEQGPYSGSVAYARAKRGQVILTEQWARRLKGTGVVAHAMHPGWADTPGVESSLPLFHRLTRSVLRTPEEGADTIVWLAAAPEAGKVTGQFWLDREPHLTHVIPGTRESAQERRQLRQALVALSGSAA